jgi:hypothetical protein
MKRLVILSAAAFLTAILWPASLGAQSETMVTAAGGGIFPSGVSYNDVPLEGVKVAMGVTILGGDSAEGQFQTTLIGISALGLKQYIEVEGKASSGSSSAADTATLSGKCTVDMADGALPLPDVPFTVVVATNAEGQGSFTLTLGATSLPAATLNEGSISIK